jgi:uncharacterized protein YbaR (Trm112 family)
MKTHKVKLLTRKEIIIQWMKQDDELLNIFCCPNCRDLLEDYKFSKHNTRPDIESEYIYCHNTGCELFNIAIENIK